MCDILYMLQMSSIQRGSEGGPPGGEDMANSEVGVCIQDTCAGSFHFLQFSPQENKYNAAKALKDNIGQIRESYQVYL